ncbi:hypothetical protein [Luteolibacter sp. LG18]|uniref:hypothetical protein n=1 Tax=Luteolibacter sp. LG18 TaxID=2819286 RepID=UPI002B2A93C5|nr:hypothetical protein llg_00240 [Luteolibacter sp. LG18]
MPKSISSLASAMLMLGVFSPSVASAAAPTYVQGDVLMGFRATGGLNASTCYVVNLGHASSFRDGLISGTVTIPGNIATDLSTIYGANWRTRTDLFWGVACSPSNISTTTVNGDPGRTVYVSIPGGGVGDGPAINTSLRTTVSTKMVALESGTTGFTSYQATANSTVAVSQGTGDANSWASFMDGGSNGGAIDFGAFSEMEGLPTQSLGLYRLTSTSAGAFVGQFSINASGQVSFTPASTGTSYSTWAATNAGGQAANLDYDGDGISNGAEFFMGTAGNGFTAAPAVVSGGVTWPRASGTTITAFKVQKSADLSIWTDVANGDSALTITGSSVHYTIPTGQSKQFVRLVVTP